MSTARKSKHAREVCGEFFGTATALRDRCREILDCYPQTHERKHVQLNEKDALFFVELMRSSVPVDRVWRTTSEGQLGRHVRFEYLDGSSELVGWSQACGAPKSMKSAVSNAMRFASAASSMELLSRFFSSPGPWRCQKSGVFISQRGGFEGEKAHVHHEGVEWSVIRDMWLEKQCISIDDVPVREGFDGRGYEMTPGDLRESWRRFHDQHARLVVVSKSWHESHHASQRSQ